MRRVVHDDHTTRGNPGKQTFDKPLVEILKVHLAVAVARPFPGGKDQLRSLPPSTTGQESDAVTGLRSMFAPIT